MQGLVRGYYPGHSGVWGNERAELLVSRAPTAETMTMEKGDIMKAIYECVLVDDARTEWSNFKLSVILVVMGVWEDESDEFETIG